MKLPDIGLTDNEEKILKLLYRKDLLSAKEVATELNIAKISALYVLKELVSKGFAKKRERYNTFIFQSTSPQKLIEHTQEKIHNLKLKINKLKPIVKELSKEKNHERGKILNLFTDKDDIKRIRRGLMDLFMKDIAKKTLGQNNLTEIFETENHLFLISAHEQVAIKIKNKKDYKKLRKLFKLHLDT